MSTNPVPISVLLDAEAARNPERVLLVDGDCRVTAQDLRSDARALAHALIARAPAGSVVAFMLPNSHEAATVYLAATYAGMIALPILPSLRDRDLAFAIADSNASFIFIAETLRGQDHVAMLSRVAADMAAPPHVVVVRGQAHDHLALASLLSEEPEALLPAIDPDAVRLMMYTSGTTGRPKGVLHSHRTMAALIGQIGAHWRVAPGDAFLVASPVSHIGGSIYAFECPLVLGSTAILMERWDADDAIRLAARERWTHMAGATPFLRQLLDAARQADTRLPDLKVFICGGAAVPPALIRDAAAWFDGAAVTRVYGSTETPVATIGSLGAGEGDHAAETDGRAGSADIRIAPHPAAPPGEGEIRVRGPQMLIGYHHKDDEAGAFDEDGYFRTGDLGRWEAGDHLVVTGRAKDIIIRNGENISAREVEDALLGHPAIAEIAVVGIPDPRTGERACACIVATGEAPGLADLIGFLDGLRVAKFKFPERLLVLDALPRNDAGKVLKEQLRQALTAAD